MPNPDIIIRPFAEQGDKQTIPDTDASGFVNFTDGYTPFYEISLTAGDPQAKAVERQIMNQMFNQLSLNAQLWQQMGIPPWLAGMPNGYAQNAQVLRVASAGFPQVFRSVVDNNTSDPANDSAKWEVQPRWSTMRGNIAMPAGGSDKLDPSAEIIRLAIDFNTIVNGTYEFATDAIAQASANGPTRYGQVIQKGLLEVKQWTPATGQNYTIQRYTEVTGRVYHRAYNGSAWTPWAISVVPENVQNGSLVYAQVAGTAPNYTASTITSFGLIVGTVLNIYFPAASAAVAATLNVNNTGAIPIVGQDGLQPSTATLFGLVPLMYESAGGGNFRWRVVSSMGTQSSGFDAVAGNQYPRLSQVQAMLAAMGKPTWNDILNKPNVVINNDPTATLGSLELGLSNSSGFIDFHVAGITEDFNTRIGVVGDGNLRISDRTRGNIVTFARGNTVFECPVQFNFSTSYLQGQAINFYNPGNSALKWQFTNDNGNNFVLNNLGVGTALWVNNANSQVNFTTRPTFAGATPWDTGNFNPATKVTLGVGHPNSAVNGSPGTILDYPGNGNIAAQNDGASWNPRNNPLVIRNGANSAASACISFLRDGSYGLVLGLDVDNKLRVGGWSYGNRAPEVINSDNLPSYLGNASASLGHDAIGTFAFLNLFQGATGYQAPGTLASGGNLRYTNAQNDIAGMIVNPSGTWRLHGVLRGAAATVDCTSVWQKVA